VLLKIRVFWGIALCQLVTLYQSTRRNNPEDFNLHRGNFRLLATDATVNPVRVLLSQFQNDDCVGEGVSCRVVYGDKVLLNLRVIIV
jgi:hypothetical protein